MRFETDVRESTLVTFAAGEVKGSGTVLFAGAGEDGNTLVVCDSTPVHPVSFRWPDQPADRGTMTGAVICIIRKAKKPIMANVTAPIAARRAAPSDFRKSSRPCTGHP